MSGGTCATTLTAEKSVEMVRVRSSRTRGTACFRVTAAFLSDEISRVTFMAFPRKTGMFGLSNLQRRKSKFNENVSRHMESIFSLLIIHVIFHLSYTLVQINYTGRCGVP